MEVHKGLADVVVSETSLSAIVEGQLSYSGYNIDELVEKDASFEEIIFLLWNSRMPSREEFAQLKHDLHTHMALSESVIACLKIQCRQNLHPMSVLRTTVSLLGVFDPYAEDMDERSVYIQAISIQAKIPTIVAAFARLRKGLDPIAPREDLSFGANFLYMLTGEEANPDLVRAYNHCLVLHADHDLNASTFTARVAASTLTDVYSCITGAIGALKGPLHGGANERVFDMLSEIAESDTRDVPGYLKSKLDNKEKIMGFGHRVYKTEDPRKKHLKRMAKELTQEFGKEDLYDLSCEVEDYLLKEKGLIPNVDFYSATVYHCFGIEHDLFTLLFSMSRVSGWLGHVFEQKREATLIRPRSKYVGAVNLTYIPLSEKETIGGTAQ